MRKDRFFSHQLVQSYLEDFSKRLHDLPPDVKHPFIQKVRSDLYEKALEKEKKGVSPEEIPQSVLMEFLSPNELAADLLKEYDREDLNHHVIKLSYSTVLATGSFGALSVPILLGFINVSAILPFVIGFIIGNIYLLFGKFTWNRTLLSHFQKTMRFILDVCAAFCSLCGPHHDRPTNRSVFFLLFSGVSYRVYFIYSFS